MGGFMKASAGHYVGEITIRPRVGSVLLHLNPDTLLEKHEVA
jgi:hypothetical protein